MKKLKLIALSLLMAGAIHAASITHTSSAAVASTPSALIFTPDIPLFNPALGVLLQVDIEFDATFDGDFSFQNQSTSDGTISGSATAEFILVGPGALGNLVVLNPSIVFAPPAIPSSTVAAGTTVNYNGLSDTDSGTFSGNSAAVLAAFTGAGPVAFSGSATQVSAPILNFSPNIFTSTVSGQADVSVKYTYRTPNGPPTEVPEPATWAFMTGGGLVLLSGVRFRKPRK
jgi:hypothetical protein